MVANEMGATLLCAIQKEKQNELESIAKIGVKKTHEATGISDAIMSIDNILKAVANALSEESEK